MRQLKDTSKSNKVNHLLTKLIAAAEDEAINAVIDDLWLKYDDDNSGTLDKRETQNFIKDTLG